MITRRRFLRDACAVSAACLAVSDSLCRGADKSQKPNVLMIPIDDLKPLLNCYGIKEIKTPNIDKLAARGTVFLNNSCQQAICGPTRASLMTGLYPDSTGVWDLKTRMRDVHPNVLSIPQYFIKHGYEATGIGKTYDPRCVDKQLDKPSWSIPYSKYSKYLFSSNHPNPKMGYQDPETKKAIQVGIKAVKGKTFKSGGARKVAMTKAAGPKVAPATEGMRLPDDAYPDGAMAAAACKMLDKLSGGTKPFFLSVGFAKPHLPFIAPKKYWDMYDRSKIKIHEFQKRSENGPDIAYHNFGELRSYSDIPSKGPIPDAQQLELIHGYMACVTYVDAQIGKLMSKIDQLGITDNTIVCLWGDHGWHLGDHGIWCKHSNFEQAVRAPLIFVDPHVKGGKKTDAPTGLVDVFPTFCDLAHMPIPAALQGKSLLPLMKNPKGSIRKAILSQYPRSNRGKPVMGYTLRDRRYRYVKWVQMNYRNGERSGLLVATELYDYETDPNETVNLASIPKHAKTVAGFEAIFKEMNVAKHSGIAQKSRKKG